MFRLERDSHKTQKVEVHGSLVVTHTLVLGLIQISYIDTKSKRDQRRAIQARAQTSWGSRMQERRRSR